MPHYVVGRLEEALDTHIGIALGRACILMIGPSYKKNASDIRESPSFKLMELIEKRGARCDYLDPQLPIARQVQRTTSTPPDDRPPPRYRPKVTIWPRTSPCRRPRSS